MKPIEQLVTAIIEGDRPSADVIFKEVLKDKIDAQLELAKISTAAEFFSNKK